MATYPTVIENENLVVTIGVQGPPGADGVDGVDGHGLAIVSETEPLTAAEGDIWFNPTTKLEKIYATGAWQSKTIDGLYF